MSNEVGPILELNINGEEVYAHRFNSALFTFAGNLACYNHVFVARETEGDSAIGNYIFQTSETYKDITKFMETEAFPQHLNLPDVADCDRDAFNRAHYLTFRGQETFPVEWTNQGDK